MGRLLRATSALLLAAMGAAPPDARRSGFEVLDAIRRNEATQATPVVVLTSSDQTSDIERAYRLGANAYLVKPVSREALLAMVRTLDAFWIKLNRVSAA